MYFKDTLYYKEMDRAIGKILEAILLYGAGSTAADSHVDVIEDLRNFGDPAAELRTYLAEEFASAPAPAVTAVHAQIVAYWTEHPRPEVW